MNNKQEEVVIDTPNLQIFIEDEEKPQIVFQIEEKRLGVLEIKEIDSWLSANDQALVNICKETLGIDVNAQVIKKKLQTLKDDYIESLIKKNMRKPTGYLIVTPLHVHTDDEDTPLGGIVKKTKWKMYEARVHPKGDADIILDIEGYINPNLTNITVAPVNPKTEGNFILSLCNEMSERGKKDVETIVYEKIPKPSEKEREKTPLHISLGSSGVLKRTISQLTNTNCLKEIDWNDFVYSLVEYKCIKDPEIIRFLLKDLLRGVNPRLNPNSIIAKPPSTGVSEFYEQNCILLGKATKKSLLGYGLNTKELYPGVAHEQDITIAIDQIESQDAVDLFGYLFNITEQGKTDVASGGIKFPVWSNSKFVFIANIQPSDNPIASFNYLLTHIVYNLPAFMKRIGVLCYNEKLEPAKAIETSNLQGLKTRAQFFRAIEKIAFPEIQKLYNNDEVWKWSQQSLNDYSKEIWNTVSSLYDVKVRQSFNEHGKGAQPRIRGAGLTVALALFLKEIVLKHSYDLKTDILNPAEEYAYQFAEMNIASTSRIANTWETQKQSLSESVFNNIFPNHIKELVLAFHFCKQRYAKELAPLPNEMPLKPLGIDYKCKYFDYFSQAINHILERKGSIKRYNTYLRKYYGFELMLKDGDEICVRRLPE